MLLDMKKASEVTPNQAVAFNLAKLRRNRGWSAEYTAEQLGQLLGRKISLASYSAIERSAETTRRKRFDADEIVAIACVFSVAIWTLFEAPKGSHLRLAGKAARAIIAEREKRLSATSTPGTLAEDVARSVTENPELQSTLRQLVAQAIRSALDKPYPKPISTQEALERMKENESPETQGRPGQDSTGGERDK